MDLKLKIKKVLRECYGEFDTYLELEYENRMVENLVHGSSKKKEAWATYNQVVLELKNSLKDSLKVKELQYKLTENTDHNAVCIEVIKDLTSRSTELERLLNKIQNF